MADKEVTLFVIDVSKFMKGKSPGYHGSSLEWCLEYVWDKLGIKIMAARKTDYVAVLAVGSQGTDHMMGDEEAYSHIRVILPFPRRDKDDLRSYTFSKSHVDVMMSELQTSQCTEGDLLSAVILGVQMITEFCLKLKFKKNLILLTKGELLSDFTDAEAVATQIKAQEINFSVLGVGFDDAEYGFKEEDKSAAKRTNEKNFRLMCDTTDGIFATYAEVAESLNTPRIKPVRPVTTFRGSLTIGDPQKFANTIEISVERYPKTKQAKTPSASKFSVAAETHSVIAQASQVGTHGEGGDDEARPTHQVLPSRTYKLQDGEELADNSQLEKGYAYGKTVVPISRADEDFLQFETTASLQILGFVDADTYTRYISMNETSLITSQKANSEAALALSSLIHALFESETFALARLVRRNNVPPTMVFLAPNIEPDFESLLEVSLPFAEDVRQYKFAPLDRLKNSKGENLEKHRYLPSQDLKAAMDDLIDAMDLDELEDADGIASDALPPEETFSYGIHRATQAILYRAFHQSSDPVPKPAEILLRSSRMPIVLSQDKELQRKAEGLRAIADTKKVPPKTANRRRRGEVLEPVKTGIDLDELLRGGEEDGGRVSSDTGIGEADLVGNGNGRTRGGIASIGQARPAEDFEAMMKDDSLIDAAFQQIQPVLEEMVQYSLGDQTYGSAIDALSVFRKHAIEQEETELFNFFFQRFGKRLENEKRGDFVELMQSKGIKEISEEEANS